MPPTIPTQRPQAPDPRSTAARSPKPFPMNNPHPSATMTTQCWSDNQISSESLHCTTPRERWPKPEAVIQVVFRVVQLILHACAFLIVLVARGQVHVKWPAQTFVAVAISTATILLEITALTSPGFSRFPRFPRLPSLYLLVAEILCILFTSWSIEQLLQPHWRVRESMDVLETNRYCPPEDCVTMDEKYGIWVYVCQLMTLVLHVGFAMTAGSHLLSRNLRKWMPLQLGGGG